MVDMSRTSDREITLRDDERGHILLLVPVGNIGALTHPPVPLSQNEQERWIDRDKSMCPYTPRAQVYNSHLSLYPTSPHGPTQTLAHTDDNPYRPIELGRALLYL